MITIEHFRIKAGLAADDTSKDTEIELAKGVALSIIEQYCNRKFAFAIEAETFTHWNAYTVPLRRYPVVEITSIDGWSGEYHFDELTGVVHLDGRAVAHRLTVNYSGGYAETASPAEPFVYPDDFMSAWLAVFSQSYTDLNSGGTVASDAAIKTLRAGDLSITYDNAVDTGSSSGGGSAFGGAIPATAKGILDLYRREFV